jgi:outer membrane protein assembly factor BamB
MSLRPITLTLAFVLGCAVACNERGNVSPPEAVPAARPAATSSSSPPSRTGALASDGADAGAPDGAGADGRGANPCTATPWASYAHDPARTSAADGCLTGPLTVTWRLTRQGTCGYKFRLGRILNVVGDENALFTGVDCGGSPAVMRVSTAGEALWTFSRADYGRGSWPALARDAVVSTDDGVFLIDRETGKWHGRELDVWGEPLVVGEAFFVDNTFQLDGSGPFVGAFDASLKWKWRASVVNAGKGKAVARTGGIAFADGLIVHAAAMGARTVPSLAAHDASTGDRRWLAAGMWPESAPSIADGRVFVVERWIGESGDRLVARALADGSVAWSTAIPWVRGPAPVLAAKLVLVHGAEGVRAHDRSTGALVWSNAVPRRAAFEVSATTMAAANGSRTLVVTSGPRVVVLNLEDGTEQWSGDVVKGTSPTALGGVTVERPVIIGKAVYLTSDGMLLRLDSK